MEPPPLAGTLYVDLIIFAIALIFCAVFSFLETSITAIRLFKLKELEESTKKYRSLFNALENDPNRILITILVAYSLANVVAAIVSSSIMEKVTAYYKLSETVGFILNILFTSSAILIADLIPKNIATDNNDSLFKSSLWVTNILYYLLYYIVSILLKFTSLVSRIFGNGSSGDVEGRVASEKEIQFLIEYINEKGLIERHKTTMLKSIFQLGTTTVKEIMVPETEIISININSTIEETLNIFVEHQYSRLPVYENEPDNIIGMIHQKDFFLLLSKKDKQDLSLKDIVRPIIFIPESAKVLKVLKDFREQRVHIAIVINEFGVMTGLVTLEDLIEEIVGEISDEYESVKENITQLKTGDYLANGSTELSELSQLLNIKFETEGALTLAGFLIEQFGYLPVKAEELVYKNYKFTVQQASPKRVIQVIIHQEIV